jgi:hypothetical protein
MTGERDGIWLAESLLDGEPPAAGSEGAAVARVLSALGAPALPAELADEDVVVSAMASAVSPPAPARLAARAGGRAAVAATAAFLLFGGVAAAAVGAVTGSVAPAAHVILTSDGSDSSDTSASSETTDSSATTDTSATTETPHGDQGEDTTPCPADTKNHGEHVSTAAHLRNDGGDNSVPAAAQSDCGKPPTAGQPENADDQSGDDQGEDQDDQGDDEDSQSSGNSQHGSPNGQNHASQHGGGKGH